MARCRFRWRCSRRGGESRRLTRLCTWMAAPVGNSLETIGLAFDSLIDPYLDERDFVLFDQRGAGFSTRRWTARAGRG